MDVDTVTIIRNINLLYLILVGGLLFCKALEQLAMKINRDEKDLFQTYLKNYRNGSKCDSIYFSPAMYRLFINLLTIKDFYF